MPSIDHSTDNRVIVQKELSKKYNIDFAFYERKTFYKNLPIATNYFFDLDVEGCFKIPHRIILSFENDNVNAQTSDGGIFKESNVTECYCKIGIATYPEK